jgi:hypothetical protein
MTELRVFQDLKDRLWIEITFPTVRVSRSLFVRAFWEDSRPTLPFPRDEIITVEFKGRRLVVAFLIVENRRRRSCDRFINLGFLDTDSSRDVLNNLLDLLAYDG